MIIAATTAAAILLTHQSARRATTPAAPSKPADAPKPRAAGTQPGPSVSISPRAVQDVLARYAAAYSAESPGRLLALFATSLVRADGTQPAENLHQALATYRHQFSQLRTPRYALTGEQIATTSGDATASATYQIDDQYGRVGGMITFHLLAIGGRLRIDHLVIRPA